MANQIGRLFAHQLEAQAIVSTADHLKKYWDPRMREAITTYLANAGEGLRPHVRSRAAVLSLSTKAAAAG